MAQIRKYSRKWKSLKSKFFQPLAEWEGRLIGFVHTSKLHVDDIYQRYCPPKLVQERSKNFDPLALRTLVTAWRPDGNFYIIDGQTRWGIMKDRCAELKNSEWILCEVHELEDREQEGDLFPKLNNVKNVSPKAKFKANLFYGAPMEKEINSIVNDHGLVIRLTRGRPNDNRTSITSLATLQQIYEEHSPKVLNLTLYVVTRAFKNQDGSIQKTALMQQMLKGISSYIAHYGTDRDVLVNALKRSEADDVLEKAQKQCFRPRSDAWRMIEKGLAVLFRQSYPKAA